MLETTDIKLTESELALFYAGYFSYFKTLNPSGQIFFITRCLKFINEKIIKGSDGFEPNNKVKAIIAASAVQLTLGLETWTLNYFDTIIIHPKDFDDKTSGVKFKGETNLKGYIRLSWESFISGYRLADDNINLGLHEFTHALRFNSITGFEQDYFVENYFDAWLAAANEPFNEIKQNKKTIFRKYGGANMNEFLSVCIEHFFESPQEIKENYPFLYYSTAILLNQQKQNGVTQIGVREKLFEEKNKLITPINKYNINTIFNKTSSFAMMMVTLVPLLYTVFVAGITSGVSIFLLILELFFYLRFDFYYITAELKDKDLFLRKGFFVFKNRKKAHISLSQLISIRLYHYRNIVSEYVLIYYDCANNSFYSESIATGKINNAQFLNEAISNRIAVFR